MTTKQEKKEQKEIKASDRKETIECGDPEE